MAPDDDDAPVLRVSVAYSPLAGVVEETSLRLARDATVADAIHASGLQQSHPDTDLSVLVVGVWGVFCERSQLLRDRDRVELYRPLLVDPKEARRRRQALQRVARGQGTPPAR